MMRMVTCDRCHEVISKIGIENGEMQFSPSRLLSFAPYDLCAKCQEAFKYEFIGIERPEKPKKRRTSGNGNAGSKNQPVR